MADKLITYRSRRGGPVQTWAYHEGSKAKATECAERLLKELREEDKGAMAYVDGRGVRVDGGGAACVACGDSPRRDTAVTPPSLSSACSCLGF